MLESAIEARNKPVFNSKYNFHKYLFSGNLGRAVSTHFELAKTNHSTHSTHSF